MTAPNYSPIKLLWATTLFFVCLFIIIFLLIVYGQQNLGQKIVTPTGESVSPLLSVTPTSTSAGELKKYVSKYTWQVSYPKLGTLDTSLEAGSTSLERVTVSNLDSEQPKTGFYGYSVDFSVESKKTTLSKFADQDSLSQTNGTRQYFSVATLAQKTGYKVLIKGKQDYINYYLPLRDDSKVLIVTTSVAGPNSQNHEKIVKQILDSLELLD